MTTDIVQQSKPTINALFSNTLTEAVPLEQLNIVLATPPPDNWVKVHPFIKDHKYLPIDKIEYLLRSCFKKFQIEVKEVKQLFNAVEVTVRVHYFNPAVNEMMYHDGVGAWDLQTQSKSGPLKLDLSNINVGAVPMATGIAKSVAIKDACDHFGTLFGANLNRKDTIEFKGNAELLNTVSKQDIETLYDLKKDALSEEDQSNYKRAIDGNEIDKYKYIFNKLNSI